MSDDTPYCFLITQAENGIYGATGFESTHPLHILTLEEDLPTTHRVDRPTAKNRRPVQFRTYPLTGLPQRFRIGDRAGFGWVHDQFYARNPPHRARMN